MKIVHIFAQRLWSIQYDGESDNEYDRLMTEWTDPSYLTTFLEDNAIDLPAGRTVKEMSNLLYEDSEKLDDALNELSKDSNQKMESIFRPLHNAEFPRQPLSKQKARKNYLRLYAIRIDEDCFVITGGAIKLTQVMGTRPHTHRELEKLDRVRSFLRENGISDSESYFEFLIEQSNDQ